MKAKKKTGSRKKRACIVGGQGIRSGPRPMAEQLKAAGLLAKALISQLEAEDERIRALERLYADQPMSGEAVWRVHSQQ